VRYAVVGQPGKDIPQQSGLFLLCRHALPTESLLTRIKDTLQGYDS
jgi:hypothetical protein